MSTFVPETTATPEGTAAARTVPIPEPPGLPLLGNTLDLLGARDFIRSTLDLTRRMGPILRLRLPGQNLVIVTGGDLVAELSDQTRFRKNVHEDLEFLRALAGDGLFTAYGDEPNWRKAHDVLLPAFSLGAMRGYHGTMLDVARGLLGAWDRAATDGTTVDVSADTTRLTFDTIGRCGFGFDFGSFERTDPHPFIAALGRALSHAQRRATYLPGTEPLHVAANRAFRRDVAFMEETVDDVIRARRASGDTSTADLLGRMLHTPDPVTGRPLDDVNIRHQVITFLIAGHETTSGALSFALHHLTKHPEALARARAEVDALWGDTDRPDPEHDDVGRLRYVRQVLNEALRLWPTAPAFAVEPLEDTVIGGRHPVSAGESLLIFTPRLHRGPGWGDNVELFDPDRFSPERERERPAHLFKPFGGGERACIGRQFALHEAVLVLGLLVHRYRFLDHEDYELRIKETLTIKPDGFTLRLARRTPADRRLPEAAGAAGPVAASPTPRTAVRRAPGTALTVLYGSNLGTCAGLARDLAADAAEAGFAPRVRALDEATGALDPADGPVLIVAASYNGRPTDDAVAFLEWLPTLGPGDLDGLRHAVLGVGDRNWSATYQRIPTLLDDHLGAAGSTRLAERAVADTSGDFASVVTDWTTRVLDLLLDAHGAPVADAGAPVEPGEGADAPPYALVDAPATALDGLAARHGLRPMRILAVGDLADTSHPLGRPKRLVRLALPAGEAYRTGDHLAVLPRNSPDLVERVIVRLGVDPRRTVRLEPRRRTRSPLPVDRPLALGALLAEVVELQAPATRDQVRTLVGHTPCPFTARALGDLADAEAFADRLAGRSVLDLLEEHPACDLPFEHYLGVLPALTPRHYSISSAAETDPDTVDLMISPLTAPHRSGRGEYRGTASHFMAGSTEGEEVRARVLPAADAFRVPLDPDVPVIMIAAGTGLAPFRGAVAARRHHGRGGRALLYFGCDHPDVDHLYREELEEAAAAGAVTLRPTFSAAPVAGARFVQDRILAEADEVLELLGAGGRVFVCGDGRAMAPGVRAAFVRLRREALGCDEETAGAWLEGLIADGRYTEDVWAG
ncbi:cytochrome P450 [Nocardiopsis lambiniae]|uniref:Bifunctional cytochrome P450/NADPH--P450 reductase n=1 Tax=Nocardiopsis lambiniae TaxID=3075539 RepID=A0ABU2MBS5_9ACTN|nr:cytochrome P450 [Nocardiopsis sp. DSM 44743]MDT0330138.1 cytochrome P450 [Nocardiopsis sp. DSM 44743]